MFDQHVIETPENISFDYPVAGIGSRFLAALIDTLIQGALYLLLAVLLVFISAASATLNLPSALAQWIPLVMSIMLIVAIFFIQFGYYLWFEIARGGRSPGKDLFHLRVIKENGYPLTALDSIIRNLVRIVDFLPFGYGVGVIVMFFNERSKRLGDFAAGTLVVRVGDQVKLTDLKKSAASTQITDIPGIENLRDADIELIETFLQRRSELDNAEQLSATITERIRAQMNTPEANALAADIPDLLLRRVAAAYRARK
jgi:uncharacterized RDD family membrane protein YckC